MAARTELENNTLSVQEHQARIQETMQCKGVKTCEQGVTEKYITLSKQRRQEAAQCTGSADCLDKQQALRHLAAAYAQRVEELQNKVEPWTPAERQEWETLSTSLLPIIDGNAALKKAIDYGFSNEAKEALWHELGAAGIAGAAGVATGVVKNEATVAQAKTLAVPQGVGVKEPTRFVDGVKVVDQKTGQVFRGTVDLGPTLDRIKSGGSFPHRNDGSIFQNRAGSLPKKPVGYYTEYVHPTPGVPGPGPQRIIVGKDGEMYYTADHYKTFISITN